jgi:polar amino acid transport system permease protein
MRIILPQAARKVVPPLGNYLVASFKSVPILAAITVQEMLGVSLTEAADTYRYYEPIALVGTMYLLMSLVAAGLVRFVEGRLAAA